MVESKLLPIPPCLEHTSVSDTQNKSAENEGTTEAEREGSIRIALIVTLTVSYLLYLAAIYAPQIDITNTPICSPVWSTSVTSSRTTSCD